MSDSTPTLPPFPGGPPPHAATKIKGTVPLMFAAPARAVLGLGVAAALLLVGHPAGLGLVALVAALGVTVAWARRRVIPRVDLRTDPGRDAWTRVWWLLAAALACLPLLRAATWVLLPALATAVAMAALAVTGGRRPAQLAAAIAAVIARVPGGAALATRAAARGIGFAKLGPAARGAGLAAVLLAIFVPLLVSADAAFAQLLDDALPKGWSIDQPGARIGAWLLVSAAGAALLHSAAKPPVSEARPPKRTLTTVEYALPLGALVALLGGFVALQLTTLFGGDRHVLATAGLTYAEYAHQGFAQLLAVAALTLAVVAAARRWAQGGRLLIVALCLLTLVVLASALKRLGLYEQAYGYTRLRLAADAAMYYLGALFVLVLVARRAAWLPRAAVAVTALAVLAFGLSDPDRRIAERNVAAGRIDRAYLATLGPDAAPALARLPRPPCARLQRTLSQGDGLAGLNLARHNARAALATVTCAE